MLQSSQDNDIAHVLQRDFHILEITRNLRRLCPPFLVCLGWVLVPQALHALCGNQRATVKALNLTETTPPAALPRTLLARAKTRHRCVVNARVDFPISTFKRQANHRKNFGLHGPPPKATAKCQGSQTVATPPPLVLPHPREDGPPPPPPLGDRTTTVHAHLQAQKLQHKSKEFSIRYVQRAANVRRPTP